MFPAKPYNKGLMFGGTLFGLGWALVTDRGAAASAMSKGAVYWGGAFCTLAWIDREQGLIGILMTQVRPYGHISIRQDFQVLASQAVVD